MSIRSSVITAVALLALVSSASADVAKDPVPQSPVEAATQLYKDGKYAEALVELEKAYALDPQPKILYAIAQVHVKLGRCPDAIVFYEKFLATNPDDKPASAARQAIDVCKTAPPPAEGTPTAVAPAVVAEPPPPPPPPEPTPLYKDPIGGALVGVGVIAGVVAIVMYRGARSDLDSAESAATYQESEDLVDSGHSKRTIAAIASGGAFALIGAGVMHMVMRDRGTPERAVAITPSTGGAIVTWSGRF